MSLLKLNIFLFVKKLIFVMLILEKAFITNGSQAPTETPSNLIINQTSANEISIKWTAINENAWFDASENRSYLIKYKVNGSNIYDQQNISSSENKYTITGLRPYTLYKITVGAANTYGQGGFAANIYGETLPSAPIAYPQTVISYNTSAYSINVSWSDIADKDWAGNITGFNIKVSTISKPLFVRYPNMTQIVAELKPFFNHMVQVSCVNALGEGPLSLPIYVMTEEEAPKISVSGTKVSNIGNHSLTVRWDEVDVSLLNGIFQGVVVYVKAEYKKEDLLITTDDMRSRIKRSTSEHFTNGLIMDKQTFIERNLSVTEMNITNLFGDTKYNITLAILTKFHGVLNTPTIIRTLESKPFVSAFNLSCKVENPRSITVEWRHSPPAFLQGIRTWYKVYTNLSALIIDPYRNDLTLIFLEPHTIYSFWLSAYTFSGEGALTNKVTCRTSEDVPYIAPANFTSSSYESPGSTNLTWFHIPLPFWRGTLLGYQIFYRKISSGDKKIGSGDLESWKNISVPYVTNYILSGIDVYSKYAITIAGRTNAGVGLQTKEQYFQTCHIENNKIPVYYSHFPPYVIKNADISLNPSGLLIRLFERSIYQAASKCKSFASNITIVYHFKDEHALNYRLNKTSSKVVLPHFEQLSFSPYYQVTEMTPIDGFTLVKVPKSQKLLLEENGNFLLNGIFAALPIFVFYFLLNAVFGGIFWFFEPTQVQHQSLGISVHGIFEGMYLAVMTSTTVGYGDKTPQTNLGRIYIVFWTFLGMGLTGIVFGNMTSILSSASINMLGNVTPDEKVIAVHDTAAFYYATKNIKTFDKNTTYHSYTEVLTELYEGRVRYALLDTNVVLLNKYELTKNGLELKQYSNFKSSIGFALFGKYKSLQHSTTAFVKTLAATFEEDLFKLKMDMENKVASLNVETKEAPTLITVESPLYQTILLYLSVTLIICVLLGIMFEMYRQYKRAKEARRIKSATEIKMLIQEKLVQFSTEMVSGFKQLKVSLTSTTNNLLTKHSCELIKLQEEISKLYDINFKYIKTNELSVPLEELVKYSDEIAQRKNPTFFERMGKKTNAMKSTTSSCCKSVKNGIVSVVSAVYECCRGVADEI